MLIDTCDTADHGLETMVFRCTEDGEVQSWSDLDARRYATVPEAEKGHLDMIEKWRSKLMIIKSVKLENWAKSQKRVTIGRIRNMMDEYNKLVKYISR